MLSAIMSALRLIVVVFSIVLLNKIECSEYKDYSRHQKFHVEYSNDQVYRQMINLKDIADDLDFWVLSPNVSIVLVPPEFDVPFQLALRTIGAAYNRTMYDDDENDICGLECEINRPKRQTSGFFSNFQRYSTIFNYLKNLAAKYPQHARFDAVTRTVGGHSLAVIRIAPFRRTGKKLIYIQGGCHGREWISVSTVLYFVTQLLENFNNYIDILEDIEIGVVPVMNPDGYEYSHTKDRLWRKNLNSNAGYCRGVDLNRNFGFKWGVIGSSKHACSEDFPGRLPFSEAETEWVRRYLRNNQYRTKLVVDVHSFGKYLFYPWGYQTRSAPTKEFLHKVALRVAGAIYKHRGTKYSVGTAAHLLYKASGVLDDYAYGELGIPLSYTIELPGTSFRSHTSEIIPIGKETFAGFIEFIKVVSSL